MVDTVRTVLPAAVLNFSKLLETREYFFSQSRGTRKEPHDLTLKIKI